ncbi:MAG: HIT family protein [Candidatus Hodarchaeota archaeon]
MAKLLFHSYLTAPWKLKYVKQKKDPNQCIFCAISKKTAGIESWEIFRDNQVMVLLNRFPYNPGHLLIVPHDHYENFEFISSELANHMTNMTQRCIKLLKVTHKPVAFNVGFNIGKIAGASIDHIHWHIVPRYLGDLNFMELLNTRVLVETLKQTQEKLRGNLKFFEEK